MSTTSAIAASLLTALLGAGGAGGPAAARRPPAPPTELPGGELGETVKLGKLLFEQTATHPLTKAYAPSALSCASCHPASGSASTLVGVATAYPAWSPREKAVITLEDRVLNCFMRSMNGRRPPNGSRASVAITTYLTWLSTGLPMRMNDEAPLGPYSIPPIDFSPARVSLPAGKAAYAARCASCHGADGQGDPPVWGPRSYNAGAGLANVGKLAGWLRATMPPDDPSLSEQDAVNVAAYVDAQPRPDFDLEAHLPAPDGAGVYNSNVRKQVIRAPTWPPAPRGGPAAKP
ncbi:c-type cytochrome [Anaeromyxobacter oryzisoli]|uniref:c-type cytochrome n=1 Tax=Anaeromyxobacter oryzisoli TaxID=2925408 RepID=UPI001F567F75|nr:c-type cytochrome [Anaeromyxobacter sp. SG63]